MTTAKRDSEDGTAAPAVGSPLDRRVRRLLPRERWRWLLQWMRDHGRADVLNADLVWSYVEATGAAHSVQMIGAPRCRQLGADLAGMARLGYAARHTTGIDDGLCFQGFPRWVWSYRPGKRADLLTPNAAISGRSTAAA